MQRSREFFVAAAVVVMLAAASPTPAAEPVNLLSNGGFEEGLAGWMPAAGHELITDPAAARSGDACLTGEVAEADRSQFLRRRIAVKANNQYNFEIWARASHRTKLVLRVVQPGATQHQPVVSWQGVPGKWRRYTCSLPVTGDGTLELNLVAPSSHGAPPGRIWIDDLALYETELPTNFPISEGRGFNDEPAVARAENGSLFVAWNSFRDGDDSLQVARYASQQGRFKQQNRFEQLGAWQVLGGKGTYLLGIRAVSAGERVVILYAAEEHKDWNVYAVTCGVDGPGKPLVVARAKGVDVKPAAAWRDGLLSVAWESNRNGCRQIFATGVRNGRVSPPVAVSEPGLSSYDPSIAVLPGGQVCVAWHGFRDGNYDVYLRKTKTDGSWGPVTRLTEAPTIDRHPQLVARGDELWLIYENAFNPTGLPYRIGSTAQRRLIVAKVAPEGLLAPKDYAQNSPLYDHCEAASGAFDSAGRLWLTLRRPQPSRAGWEAAITCLDGNGWQRPAPLSSQKGMDRPVRFVLDGDRAVVALQVDDMPRAWWRTRDEARQATSNIFLASVALDSTPPTGPVMLEPLAEPEEPYEPAQIRIARGEDTPTPSIDYNGQELKLFFGDLHEHTDLSICGRTGDQSINESYQHMRDVARLDFACTTDHGFNINAYLWNYTAKLARVNDDPHRYLTFLAEEWTSQFKNKNADHPYGYYGHRNLIFADLYFPRWWNGQNGQTPAQLWEELRKLNANFVNIPHQLADTGCIPTDWNFTDEEAQPVAEIFQVRGSYEYKGTQREANRTTPGPGYFIQDAWARGIVIGVIASPDHGGGYGKACVWAPQLTREAVLDAIRSRHCYGTTAAKIILDVRVNGHLMGDKLSDPAGESVEVKINVRCPADIDRVEVCRNNRFIYTKSPEGREAGLTFVDRDPPAGRSYYYVRVVQKDEEIAWSSPVWFGAE